MIGPRLQVLRSDVRSVLPAFVVARILVAVSFVMTVILADDLAPGDRPDTLRQGLTAWDGQWYESIARHGYDGIPREGVRFFPLFPLLGRVLRFAFLGHHDLALIAVSNLAALAFALLLRRLVLVETQDEDLARTVTWVAAVFPSAFVLVWAYAESLMLAASVGAFLALRRRRWWWAAGLGLLAGAARPLGLFLAVPAFIEAIPGIALAPWAERAKRGAAVLGPVVGAGSYLLWASVHFNDFLVPLTVQEDLRGEAAEPFSRIWSGLGDLFGAETFGDGLHIPFAVAFVVLLVLGFRRWPLSYSAFAGIVLVTSLAADNLNSLERYGLNAFPLVLTLAVLARRWKVEQATLILCGAGLVALNTLAAAGSYVP